MYYFVEAFGKDKEWMEKQFGTPESSDISDIEGFVVEDDRLKEIKKACKVKVYDIPERYQDCINDFVTDYWDGDFTFEQKRWIEAN